MSERASTDESQPRLFCALLKFWRAQRGWSQLDLALHADVSARHVSFLETGRARPSREMVLRLGAALDLPLRDQNGLLDAAGFDVAYDEPGFGEGLTPAVRDAVARMLAQHEPFPMVVMNRRYDILRANRGAAALLGQMVARPDRLLPTPNAMTLLFDPAGLRPFVVDWERAARALLSRLHREALRHPADDRLTGLLESLLAFDGVPEDWREPDFTTPQEPTFRLNLVRDERRLSFLTTVTVFSAPQNVTLEELRIESYFPLDKETEAACGAAV